MRAAWTIAAILVPILAGCHSSASGQEKNSSAISRTPPSEKEVIRLLLSFRDIPLSIHESCASAGTKLTDKDMGDYVSGWLAELKKDGGANWIDTSASPEKIEPGGQPGWKCTVMFRHVNGDDRWGWGVSFLVRATDRQPVQNSIRCLGAG